MERQDAKEAAGRVYFNRFLPRLLGVLAFHSTELKRQGLIHPIVARRTYFLLNRQCFPLPFFARAGGTADHQIRDEQKINEVAAVFLVENDTVLPFSRRAQCFGVVTRILRPSARQTTNRLNGRASLEFF